MITSIPSADDPPQSTREQLRAALATALCKQRFKRLCTEEEITLAASQVRLRTFWITMLPKALIAMWFSISLGFFVADVLDLHWLLYLLLAVMVAWSLVPLAAPEILQVLGGGRPWIFGLRPDPRPNLVLVLAAGWILLGAAEAVLGGPTAMAITHGVPVLVALLAGGVVLIVLRLRSDRGIEGSIPLGVPIAVVLLFVPLFSQELWVAAAGLSVPRFLLLQMITVLLLLILLWRQLRASAPTVFVETARELQVMDPDGKSDDPLKRLDKLVDMDLSSQEARELVESSLRNPKTPRRAVVIAAQAKSSFDRQLIGRLVPVVVGIGLTACLYIYLLASVTIDMQSVAGWTGEAVRPAR